MSVPALITTVFMGINYVLNRTRTRFQRYEKLIVDNIREHTSIFDHRGRLVSWGRENLFPSCFSVNSVPLFPPEHPFAPLNAILGGLKESSLIIRDGDIAWLCRYKPLPGRRGSILTVLDISEEQFLVDTLTRMRRTLVQRERLLVSLGNMGVEEQVARIQEHVTRQIDAEVKRHLKEYTALLDEVAPWDTLINSAEGSLAEVRRMVAELTPWRPVK